MNKYLLVNHGTGPSEKWEAYFQMLSEKGHIVGGSALDHGVSVTDGKFGEPISPTITGYIVVQAESLDAAQELAVQCPVHQAGGTVEIFTLVQS